MFSSNAWCVKTFWRYTETGIPDDLPSWYLNYKLDTQKEISLSLGKSMAISPTA